MAIDQRQSADSLYRDAGGQSYLQQRDAASSSHVQALRASLFSDLGGPEVRILDFGCGTGGVLSRIEAEHRIGIEIGTEAAAIARFNGIEVLPDLAQVATASIDAAISFHAIEHVENPVAIVRELGRVVRPGGHLRLIVPGEAPLDSRQSSWRMNADMHLYTWTPLIFGNLAHVAGMRDIRTSIQPMPTKSRAVRFTKAIPALSSFMHQRVADRQNSWNVILDAHPAH